MEMQATKAAEAMRKNGFEVVELEDANQARQWLLSHIKEGESVGAGGSISVREVGILEALEEKGCPVYTHWNAAAEEKTAILQKARCADLYLTSANAVTKDGRLVLIDGTGNRVGAVCDGPQQVIFIVSHSKLVDGGVNEAVARIKKQACPPNASRLGLKTPCAVAGHCGPDCPDSMCRLTLTVDRTPRGRQFIVLWVAQSLGY